MAKINNAQVYYKDTSAFSLGYGTLLAQGDTYVSHNSDGEANISLYLGTAYNQWLINVTNTKSWALPKINRASSVSCPDITLGTEVTITVTKENNSFTHKVSYLFGDTSDDGIANGLGIKGVIYQGANTEIPWNPDLESFAKIIPTKTKAQGSMICETYSGTTLIGSKSIIFNVSIPSTVKPSLVDVHYSLDNSLNSIINQWNVAVQGFTKTHLQTIEGEVSGIYGSTITRFEITGEYSTTVDGENLDYIGSIIYSYGVKSFSVVAVDSRGRKSNKKTVKVTYLEYSNPYITNFVVSRNKEEPNNLDAYFNAVYSKVGGLNVANTVLNYKKKSESTWKRYGVIEPGKNVTISDNPSTPEIEFEWYSSYNLSLTITDSIGNSFNIEGFVPTLGVTMDFAAGGKAVSFGKTAEIQDSVEIYDRWDFYVHGKEIKELIFESMYPIGCIYTTISDENPSVTFGFGDWEKWGSGRFVLGVDEDDSELNSAEMTGGTKTEEISDLYVTGSNYGGTQTAANTGSYESRIYVTPPNIKNTEASAKHIEGTTSHNNMPPYITCYMWKRIA